MNRYEILKNPDRVPVMSERKEKMFTDVTEPPLRVAVKNCSTCKYAPFFGRNAPCYLCEEDCVSGSAWQFRNPDRRVPSHPKKQNRKKN